MKQLITFILTYGGVYNMLIPDAPTVADMSDGATLLPEVAFNFRCHKAEYVAVPKRKESKGPYIKAQHVITGPGDSKFIGRFVFMNYSLSGDGSFKLKELLKVTGKPDDFRLSDDQELVGLEFGGLIGTEKGTEGYSDKSIIKRHTALVSQQPA